MFCPSRIICKKDNSGTINVTHYHTHSHPILFKETQHHPLPKSVLEHIKMLVDKGCDTTAIIDSLDGNVFDRQNRKDISKIVVRKHAVTKRQIREIARKLAVNRQYDKDDGKSVYKFVQQLIKEDFNIVLLYKPQGRKEYVIN